MLARSMARLQGIKARYYVKEFIVDAGLAPLLKVDG